MAEISPGDPTKRINESGMNAQGLTATVNDPSGVSDEDKLKNSLWTTIRDWIWNSKKNLQDIATNLTDQEKGNVRRHINALARDMSDLDSDLSANEKSTIKNRIGVVDPVDQVKSDWNAPSGPEQILNKPNLATVATSGAYSDLSGKPTIPPALTNGNMAKVLDGVAAPANPSSDKLKVFKQTTGGVWTPEDLPFGLSIRDLTFNSTLNTQDSEWKTVVSGLDPTKNYGIILKDTTDFAASMYIVPHNNSIPHRYSAIIIDRDILFKGNRHTSVITPTFTGSNSYWILSVGLNGVRKSNFAIYITGTSSLRVKTTSTIGAIAGSTIKMGVFLMP